MSTSVKSEPSTTFNNNDLIRIVMVGKTGAGKSATGNTILRKQVFKSYFSPESLTTCCEKVIAEVDGEKIAIIDTPGLFDTSGDEETTIKNISQCISYASPGPHIFLIVVRLGKITDEEKQTILKIQKIFGADADKYSLVLFTYGEQLKGTTIDKFLGESSDLQELVAKCNHQYHVFSNEVEDPSQVTELLKKIRNINERNGGSYYTNEMFQKAEERIEEEKQRILRENEKQMKEEEEKRAKEIEKEYEPRLAEVKDDEEKMIQLKAEKQNKIDKERANLRKFQESQARQKAESSTDLVNVLVSVLDLVNSVILLWLTLKQPTIVHVVHWHRQGRF